MDTNEIKKEMVMTYTELVQYLLNKYGKAQYDYFLTSMCKSKNTKVSRTNEGLSCHHIDEDKAIMLCNDKFAINNPFEYQKADRLVYCNIFEHLILHIKIVEEPKNVNSNVLEEQGIGGITIICAQINDYFNGYSFKQPWLITVYDLVKDNFEDYINILKYFLSVVEKSPMHFSMVNKEQLSIGWDKQIVKKVYLKLVG